jgi:hypothetical protein
VRELGPFVLLLCACGAAVREPPAPSASTPVPAAVTSAETPVPDTVPSFDVLAARGPALAPGMREVARKEGAPAAVDLVKAETRDACVRVAYAASAPVTASLVDHAGGVLAASEAPATEGALGAKGPVCIRKGDVVRGITDAAGVHVRWLAWSAP